MVIKSDLEGLDPTWGSVFIGWSVGSPCAALGAKNSVLGIRGPGSNPSHSLVGTQFPHLQNEEMGQAPSSHGLLAVYLLS